MTAKRVVAIVGSYRKGGTAERAVEAILQAARSAGAITQMIRLIDCPIEFCTNCRQCTQNPGEIRVPCVQHDGLEQILSAVEAADAIVLSSPVNYFNVTAIFRRFQERLLGYTYWPWGRNGPDLRSLRQPRKAVLIATAGMPGFLIPLATGAARALRVTARVLGARTVARLWIGLAAGEPHHALSPRTLARAAKIGLRLA
jgi:putative NADPH-quinone reductase